MESYLRIDASAITETPVKRAMHILASSALPNYCFSDREHRFFAHRSSIQEKTNTGGTLNDIRRHCKSRPRGNIIKGVRTLLCHDRRGRLPNFPCPCTFPHCTCFFFFHPVLVPLGTDWVEELSFLGRTCTEYCFAIVFCFRVPGS
jgi:hypothetical protein